MRQRKLLLGLVLGLGLATVAMDTTTPSDGGPSPRTGPAAGVAARADQDTDADPGTYADHADPDDYADPTAYAAPKTYYGRGFDTCQAPSTDAMRSWLASDYGAVGVYFGGRGRACADQKHLSRDWLQEVDEMGWGVLPVYVGSQSPCVVARNKQHVRIGSNPWKQGTREGGDAVEKAEGLGIEPESPLYLDMESYRHERKACARDTLSFVRAWNREVRSHGYVPGFYSSANSGVRHMDQARRAGVRDLPSVMWFARWHTAPDVNGEPALGRDAWQPKRRIHQYAGNVTERHGGRTITIDRNLVDAPVATLG